MTVEYLENKIKHQGGNPARMLRPDPGGSPPVPGTSCPPGTYSAASF
jgi:hypothetical protein